MDYFKESGDLYLEIPVHFSWGAWRDIYHPCSSLREWVKESGNLSFSMMLAKLQKLTEPMQNSSKEQWTSWSHLKRIQPQRQGNPNGKKCGRTERLETRKKEP